MVGRSNLSYPYCCLGHAYTSCWYQIHALLTGKTHPQRYAYCFYSAVVQAVLQRLLTQNTTICNGRTRSTLFLCLMRACTFATMSVIKQNLLEKTLRVIQIAESPAVSKVLHTISQLIHVKSSKLYWSIRMLRHSFHTIYGQPAKLIKTYEAVHRHHLSCSNILHELT